MRTSYPGRLSSSPEGDASAGAGPRPSDIQQDRADLAGTAGSGDIAAGPNEPVEARSECLYDRLPKPHHERNQVTERHSL